MHLDPLTPEPIGTRAALQHHRAEPGLGKTAGDPKGSTVSIKRYGGQRDGDPLTRPLVHAQAVTLKTRLQMPRLIMRHKEKSTGRLPSSISAVWARTPFAFNRPGYWASVCSTPASTICRNGPRNHTSSGVAKPNLS